MKGLTWSKVAQKILPKWVDIFGTPSIIMSDQDPKFVANWWKTMCALMGIQTAYSHAYHHQANGKAERTGKEIKAWLTRVCQGDKNWVEYLPHVRQLYHDTAGLSGLSPYQIVSGRERQNAGMPYEGVRAEAAEVWFQKQKDRQTWVQVTLQREQDKRITRANEKRAPPTEFRVGEWGWYRHPHEMSSAQHPIYTGPFEVKQKVGESSWQLWTGQRTFMAHTSWLKTYWGPVYGGKKTELAYYKIKKNTTTKETQQEWIVDKILKHKKKGTQVLFSTVWKGYTEEEATWEPLGNFIHRYSSDLVMYAREHNLMDLSVLRHLSAEAEDDQSH